MVSNWITPIWQCKSAIYNLFCKVKKLSFFIDVVNIAHLPTGISHIINLPFQPIQRINWQCYQWKKSINSWGIGGSVIWWSLKCIWLRNGRLLLYVRKLNLNLVFTLITVSIYRYYIRYHLRSILVHQLFRCTWTNFECCW